MKREHFTNVRYFLVVGLLSTITMDIAALLILKTGLVQLGPYRVVPGLLGRWIAGFAHGNFVHSTILETAPVPHEKLLGLVAHYLIGLTLTSLLLFPHVRIWHRGISLRAGALYGLATCVFPWFLMFPAMGFGVMGLDLPGSSSLASLSTLNHVAFGLGIVFWSNVIPVSKWHFASPGKQSLAPATRSEVTTPG